MEVHTTRTTSSRDRPALLDNPDYLVQRASLWWDRLVLRVHPVLLVWGTMVVLDLLDPRDLLELQAPQCTEDISRCPSPAPLVPPGLLDSPLG